MMDNNILDKVIAYFSPKTAWQRSRYRALYNASIPSRTRRNRSIDAGDANYAQGMAGWKMVTQARELEQNYDVATGVLDYFAARIVGEKLQTQPLIERPDGTLHTELNARLKDDYNEWLEKAEITGMGGGELQNLSVRTWQRDGEVFFHFLEGFGYPHRTETPLSIEVIETDQIPYDSTLNDNQDIIHGVRLNRFRQPLSYLVDIGQLTRKIKEIPAAEVGHLKIIRRFGQIRGVSIFHPVFRRLEGLDDYEQSELVKARIYASITAQIIRDKDMIFDQDDLDDEDFDFKPGLFYKNNLPGERVDVISADVPNANLNEFRGGQLRLASRGVSMNYSDMSATYDKSYSAQRAENISGNALLVPKGSNFRCFWQYEVYARYIRTLLLYSDTIPLREINPKTVTRALHRSPNLPWIDPLKEASARKILLENGLSSRSQLLREAGFDPDEAFLEMAKDKERLEELGLSFQPAGAAKPPSDETEADEEADASSEEEEKIEE